MGTAKEQRIKRRGQQACDISFTPVCECCSLNGGENDGDSEEAVKELVVIGAGPHGMALVLRLLQPDADLMSEKERHYKAEHHSTKMRPIHDVRKYVRELKKGNMSVLKKGSKIAYSNDNPPPIDLIKLRKSALIIDRTTPPSDRDTGWLSGWNRNFDAIKIPYLRSPTSAHLDPYDMRTLDIYSETNRYNKQLISLEYLKQRDKEFHGPYQAPSTSLFEEFHSTLSKTYGIHDMVQSSAEVVSIEPKSGVDRIDQEPYFEVHVRRVNTNNNNNNSNYQNEGEAKDDVITVKTRRVVCAMGPMFQTGSEFWEQTLPDHCRDRILHCHEIVPWLIENRKHGGDCQKSLLIVGGGITSTHLALLAANQSWCKSLKLIHRSRLKERQFDIENKWMGPLRGKLFDDFFSLDSSSRVQFLKDARKGGSVPPELALKISQAAQNSQGRVDMQQEVQISDVTWAGDHFDVQLDDGSSELCFDMIWLATGADNDIELYKPLRNLKKELPIEVLGGLPVLDSDLSWKLPPLSSSPEDSEPPWKGVLRRRIHIMGCLAGLQLGPDALNLMGARHGAVRVAKAIRLDMNSNSNSNSNELLPNNDNDNPADASEEKPVVDADVE